MTLVDQYLAEYVAQRGIARSTERKIQRSFNALKELTDLNTATETDFLKAVSKIRARKEWSQNYTRELIHTLKAFALWKYPDSRKIKGIKLPPANRKTKTNEQLLKIPQVKDLIKACKIPRDTAFIAVCYDGSNRPGELLALNWGDIHFDEFGAWFKTGFKTGKERAIRLTFSVAYLKRWHECYPLPITPDLPVFLTLTKPYKRLSRDALYDSLRKTDPNIKPSIFRPSKITQDIEEGWDQSVVMLKNWGHLATRMLDTYAHPSQDLVHRYTLQRAGLEEMQEKIRDDALDSIQCPHCHAINAPTDLWCKTCLKPLADEARTLEERILAEIHETKIYKEYERRIAQLEKDLAELKGGK